MLTPISGFIFLVKRNFARSLTPGTRDIAKSKMTGRIFRCISASRAFPRKHCIGIDDAKMIVRRGTLWMIVALVLLASLSTSVKPRSRLTTKGLHQQQRSRTRPGLVKVSYKQNREDELAHGASSDRMRTPSRIPSNYSSRMRRNVGDYTTHRNASDYYAERRAIMERYHARQREINARYANRTGLLGSRRNDVVASQYRPMTGNATLFNLDPNRGLRDSATFRYPYIRVDPLYGNESWNDGISIGSDDNRRDIAPGTNFGFKSDADLSQTRNSSNIERNALDYVTPTPCTNVSLSGTFAPKAHTKYGTNYTRTEEADRTNNNNNSIGSDYQNWGTCEGKIVYQHNLLLGLRGPSNLDTLFEVIIQGPVCITCVEVLRYNETRATVTLDSGGRGHEYAKIRLKGYENEGFSYIIKVWGVKKIGQTCDK